MHSKTDKMLFPVEVNRLLGYKGSSVRVAIRPKWITIAGPANRGYRFLFDKNDVAAFRQGSAAAVATDQDKTTGMVEKTFPRREK